MDKVAIPAHVPAGRVVDLNYKDLPGSDEDVLGAFLQLRDVPAEAPGIVWSPYNGGHWIMTRAATIEAALDNWQLFSSTQNAIPKNAVPNLPLEIDPPDHTPLRAIISPLFRPATLVDVERRARMLARELVDGIVAEGRCEFVGEIAHKLPIRMFLSLMELPFEDAPMLLDLADKRVRSPEIEVRNLMKVRMLEYLADKIEDRRTNPGGDWISAILKGTIDGRSLTRAEEQNLLATVMFGGLDTVASVLGFMMLHLARSPSHRRQLREDRTLVPGAVNEILRAHGVVSNARVVTTDRDFMGVPFKAGDVVLLPAMLAGLDDEKYPDALRIDYKRPNAGAHATFGSGPHRCPGANLARTELKVVLEEWFDRIPEFALAPTETVTFGYGGVVNSVNNLVLTWDVQPV